MVVEVLVKAAHGTSDKLGDCSCCHKGLMLEEKNVSYILKLLNPSDKLDWFLEINPEGTVPVYEDADEKWVPDSDAIAQIIEEKYHESSLITPSKYSTVYVHGRLPYDGIASDPHLEQLLNSILEQKLFQNHH